MLKQWQDPTLAEGFSTIVKISAHNPTSSGSARVSNKISNQRVTRGPARKQHAVNPWKKPTISTAARNKMQKRPTSAPVRKQQVLNAWGKPITKANAWQKPRSQDRPLRTSKNTTQRRQQPPQQQYPRQQQRYQRRPNPVPAAAASRLNSSDAPMPQRVHRQPSANPSASRSPWGGFAGPHPAPTQAWKWPRQTYMQSSHTPNAAPGAQKSQPEPPPPAIPLPNMLRVSLNARA